MDEDDREYGSSDNEQDELMEDADDAENDTYGEDFNEDEEEEQEEQEDPERDPEPEAELDESQAQNAHDDPNAPDQTTSQTAAATTPSASGSGAKWRPTMRPEYITASTYDIVPTMAAPQATSINAVAVTPDMRYWLTGGSDGYIRKFDGIGTINGKQQLTVAQKHPFVDSVVKSGVLMSYWDNQEWTGQNTRDEDRILSPVYSLAVHRQALWALSGLESGGINLQSVRHDEGKKIACLRTNGHTNAVSVLQLAPDEKSVLSGSWDKTVLDWDLNGGSVIRRFEGSGGQIAAIELRPTSGAPIPAEASDPEIITDTFDSNNAKPVTNGFFSNGNGDVDSAGQSNTNDGATNDAASPEHESLFGSPAGSLFGDNETIGGGNAFGDDEDDNEFSRAMGMELKEEQKNQGHTDTDFPMGDAEPLTDTNAAQGSGPEANGAADDGAINMDVSNGDSSHTMSDLGNQATASTDHQQQQPQQDQNPAPQADHEPIPFEPVTTASPSMVYNTAPPPAPQNDETQTAPNIFMAASIDGTIRIWDRRVPDPVARIGNRRGVPPWCMGACWSVDGNWIYAGRRNGTVEEFSIHKARGGWQPERTLKFPNGSGAVSCVRPMPNGRHIICASHDILRLWDLQGETQATKHSKVPFVVVPGPPKAGVISQLYIDPTSRIMISAAGTRGWDGTSTEVLIGYEISPVK